MPSVKLTDAAVFRAFHQQMEDRKTAIAEAVACIDQPTLQETKKVLEHLAPELGERPDG